MNAHIDVPCETALEGFLTTRSPEAVWIVQTFSRGYLVRFRFLQTCISAIQY